MTDRFTKLTIAIPVTKVTAPKIAVVVLKNWVMPYGIPNIVLTDETK